MSKKNRVKSLYCISPLAFQKASLMPSHKENIAGAICSDFGKHSKNTILGQWDKLVQKKLSGVWLTKSSLKEEFKNLHKMCPNFGKRGGTDSKVFVSFTFSSLLKEGLILKESVK